MARHALVEAPETAIIHIPQGALEAHAYDLGGQALATTAHHADLLADNAAYFAQTGAPHLAHSVSKEAAEEYAAIETTLETIRDQIASVPDSALAEDYLRVHVGAEYDAAIQSGAQHPTILQWLGDERNGATDSQLLDFTLHHLETLAARRTDPEDLETIAWARADYIAKVEQQVDAGVYDKHALQTLDKVRKAKVVIGDIWDTQVLGLKGYHLYGQDFVVVGQRVYDDEEAHQEVHDTIIHELHHLQFPGTDTEPNWLHEALAEHGTQAMLHGDWDAIDPQLRSKDKMYYASERRLLHILLTMGRQLIPARMVTKAHTGQKSGKSALAFHEAIAHNWAPDIFDWTNTRVGELTKAYEDQGIPSTQAQSAAAEQTGNELLVLVQGMHEGYKK